MCKGSKSMGGGEEQGKRRNRDTMKEKEIMQVLRGNSLSNH